jgi:serine/threonine-protein kinase
MSKRESVKPDSSATASARISARFGPTLFRGKVVAGRYELESLVGEGSTGLIVRATDRVKNERVALKFLRPSLVTDELRLRFARESRAIAALVNPHVVRVLETGADGDMPFMVLEHLEGQDLRKLLKKERRLSVADTITCSLHVCEALALAHARGIVHRDLKPANLFVTKADGGPFVKVLDFGISKILDREVLAPDDDEEVTRAQTSLGSPRYMAPEQIESSKHVDARADLWSVGTVTYEMLIGEPAFPGHAGAASYAVLHEEPAPLAAQRPDCPPALAAVVARCLRKKREERFSSAAELSSALAQAAPRT